MFIIRKTTPTLKFFFTKREESKIIKLVSNLYQNMLTQSLLACRKSSAFIAKQTGIRSVYKQDSIRLTMWIISLTMCVMILV